MLSRSPVTGLSVTSIFYYFPFLHFLSNISTSSPTSSSFRRFEQKFDQMNQTISDLEGRLRTSEDSRHQLEDVSAELKAQLFAANDRVKSLETDLRIEKEWRSQATTSLQVIIYGESQLVMMWIVTWGRG